MMEDAIKNFPKQFAWKPEIQNPDRLARKETTIVAGMGGSHLAADIVSAADPSLDIVVHSDYGLAGIPEGVLQNSLVVASSYSGNTKETVSVFEEALERNLSVAAISVGGKLLELAKASNVPYIQIPGIGIQPRMALGFSFKALLKMVGEEDMLKEAASLAQKLNSEKLEPAGKALAEKLKDKIPVVYASNRNYAIAYNWKITFNETAKIPAFYNLFPELNHNEMTGFDLQKATKELSERFYFLFLKDTQDGERIQKRMEVTKSLYESRGLAVEIVELAGIGRLERIFSSLLIADLTAYSIAKEYGVEAEQVLMVEEFKKLIS